MLRSAFPDCFCVGPERVEPLAFIGFVANCKLPSSSPVTYAAPFG